MLTGNKLGLRWVAVLRQSLAPPTTQKHREAVSRGQAVPFSSVPGKDRPVPFPPQTAYSGERLLPQVWKIPGHRCLWAARPQKRGAGGHSTGAGGSALPDHIQPVRKLYLLIRSESGNVHGYSPLSGFRVLGVNSENSFPKFTGERQLFHYTFLFDAYILFM